MCRHCLLFGGTGFSGYHCRLFAACGDRVRGKLVGLRPTRFGTRLASLHGRPFKDFALLVFSFMLCPQAKPLPSTRATVPILHCVPIASLAATISGSQAHRRGVCYIIHHLVVPPCLLHFLSCLEFCPRPPSSGSIASSHCVTT